jgi:hypothetical protein
LIELQPRKIKVAKNRKENENENSTDDVVETRLQSKVK